ncbi:DNA polymerase delta subunit 2 isoform X2 [Nomia melanderi]|uniref:DNA polymerase delta subunit 2 isoform X2 n=1 Tax=Nomia melanderi TaxID=2448451 RepID=UPI003FCD9503
METHSSSVYHRKSLKLENFEKFKLCSKSFEKQYCNIYNARLTVLRDLLLQKARDKWAQNEILFTLSELSEKDQDNDYIVIGSLYKHQELKPSILHELSEELQLTTQLPRTNYASFKDVLFLEDNSLRIKLVGNHMNIQNVVTGIICAVLGHQLENGAFYVTDWCYPGCIPKLTTISKPLDKFGKILIISGLDLANNTQSLSLNLFSEWITGMIGCNEVQKEVASIACIIIAAQCCPIILMPGEFDPSCHAIPQQAFHPCILPQTSRLKSFYAVTNPWIGSINSRIIAGSSGQPISDIMKVAGLANASPLSWLECTLIWSHYAPTAPDTVPAYPYSQIDPFVMTEFPDIYFVGNMDKYDTKLVAANERNTRLICIPKFSETQTAVLIDLQDLRTWPVSFGVC